MATSEQTYLAECRTDNMCPYCHKTFPPEERIGSGRKSEGGFCSLDCYTKYHATDILERQSRLGRPGPQA